MWMLRCKNLHFWKSIVLEEACPECGLTAHVRINLDLIEEKPLVKNLESAGYRQALPKPAKEEG